jgi:hypothetical protein
LAPTETEHNREAVRQLVSDAWTAENLELVDELVSEEYVEYAPWGEMRGVEGYKEGIRTFNTAFPDLDIFSRTSRPSSDPTDGSRDDSFTRRRVKISRCLRAVLPQMVRVVA